MRVITKEALRKELTRTRERGWDRIFLAAERAEGLPPRMLFALASQETDMNDVVGDGGHGRGLFQIDDRWHGAFLGQHGAAGPGRTPPVAPAARYAAKLVRGNLEYGRRKGVRREHLLKYAASAYNAGQTGALNGYAATGDSDANTTGGNYGAEVLRRLAVFVELSDGVRPLRRGSRSNRVTKLKEKLAGWYARRAPGAYEAFAVKPGPHFGVALERAVQDFQRRNRLEVDGIVGPKTLEALER